MTDPVAILDRTWLVVTEGMRGNIYPPGRRIQLQVAYCNLVVEHHCAIAHLLNAKTFASAMALARPIYEALVKGLWLYYCASDEQLERHAGGKELDQIGDLIARLQSTGIPKVVISSLALVKSKYWKTLCSLTHVGHTQLRHWINPNTGVELQYPDQALVELANFASFMLIAAGRELALRADNHAASAHLTAMLPKQVET